MAPNRLSLEDDVDFQEIPFRGIVVSSPTSRMWVFVQTLSHSIASTACQRTVCVFKGIKGILRGAIYDQRGVNGFR